MLGRGKGTERGGGGLFREAEEEPVSCCIWEAQEEAPSNRNTRKGLGRKRSGTGHRTRQHGCPSRVLPFRWCGYMSQQSARGNEGARRWVRPKEVEKATVWPNFSKTLLVKNMRKMIALVKHEVSKTWTQGIEWVERRKHGNTFIQQIFRGVQHQNMMLNMARTWHFSLCTAVSCLWRPFALWSENCDLFTSVPTEPARVWRVTDPQQALWNQWAAQSQPFRGSSYLFLVNSSLSFGSNLRHCFFQEAFFSLQDAVSHPPLWAHYTLLALHPVFNLKTEKQINTWFQDFYQPLSKGET